MAALKKQWEREVIKVEFASNLREPMELSAWLRTLGGDSRGCMIEDELGKVLRPNHRLKNGEFITIKYPIDEDELP